MDAETKPFPSLFDQARQNFFNRWNLKVLNLKGYNFER